MLSMLSASSNIFVEFLKDWRKSEFEYIICIKRSQTILERQFRVNLMAKKNIPERNLHVQATFSEKAHKIINASNF